MSKRNYGIDLLRIVAMFYVIVLHTLGHGGVLKNVSTLTPQFAASWTLETIAYCAVDVFVLISGYMGYSDEIREFSLKKYVLLWLEVVFYGIAVALVFLFIKPELVNKTVLLNAVLPVARNRYWYFTAYTGLVFIMPFLDASISRMETALSKRMLVVLFLVFIVYDHAFKRFGLNNGYSFAFVVILYTIGALIRKCEIGKNIGGFKSVTVIIALTLFSAGWKLIGASITHFPDDAFISYTSPTIVVNSVLYIFAFSRLRLSNRCAKLVNVASPSAFAAYLLNENRLIRKTMINDKFVYLANAQVYRLIMTVVVFSLLFLIASILIDLVRRHLFKMLRAEKLAQIISARCVALLTGIENRIR